MKKIAISAVVIIMFVLYSFIHSNNGAALPTTASGSSSTSNSSGSTTGVSSTSSSGYKDGTYTGSAADAFYGNIQVQATISGGKITNVQFLQYPNDRRDSIQINEQAVPILSQEAIQAQNAQVDIVSGATDSSQAFIESLQTALDQAKS